MRVSLSIVKQFIDIDLPVEELVQRINQQLGGVEEIIDLGAKYKDALIVRVVEAEQHPNADRLRVCKIDDGGVNKDVPRDENGLVQVVCGAPNAVAGMTAVWLPPGATVPASYGTEEPFVLSARELRGVLSQGMLAAADELGIGSDHDGIVEITEADLPPSAHRHSGLDSESSENKSTKAWILNQVQNDTAVGLDGLVGRKFAEVFGLDDYAIDIENKMFTHRPDCFGQLGVAREISAILGGVTDASEGVVDTRFENPDWYWLMPEFQSASGLELKTFNDTPSKVPRIMFAAMDNVEVKPSPLWLQCALVAMGAKPINNIVDVTNYVMLLTAQPTHAYDYDKLRGATIGARMAIDGETVTLLNSKTYTLTSDDIVIADADGPIALGGIMGGANTEVDDATKRIVLEVATFDMYTVRKSSMHHGVFTDALTRFNKGQSPLQNNRIMELLMTSMSDVSPATQASDVIDLPEQQGSVEVSLSGEIAISDAFINQRLGSDLTVEQIGNLLRRANFASYPSEEDKQTLLVTAPFWRTDIELPEDIVEEVGRLYGFDKLPRELPSRQMKPTPVNQMRLVKQAVRDSLSKSGANEVLTYSFVHENILSKAQQDKAQAFRLSNALSPDLQYYRLSVLPSLLDKVHMNIKAGHDEFVLYEIGKGHDKTSPEVDEDGLPVEYTLVDMVYASKKPGPGAPYFQMKRVVDQLFRDLGIAIITEAIDEEAASAIFAPFDQKRSVIFWSETRNSPLGIVGELKQEVARAFKLPEHTAAASLDLKFIEMWHEKARPNYRPLSRYPSVSQDISLRVDASVAYTKVYETVQAAVAEQAGEAIATNLDPVTIYQPENETTKTVTLRLTATSHERTLRDEDVKPLLEHAAGKALEVVGATLV